jgi:hypothetical protein
MNHVQSLRTAACAVLCLLGAATARAELVTYNFSTGALQGGQGPQCGLQACPPNSYFGFASDAFVTGSFQYDATALATGTVPGGATFYGIQNISPQFPASYANLVGTVQGYSFSDSRGTTTVGNDVYPFVDLSQTPPVTTFVDFLQLNTQSTTPTNGFTINGYTLKHVRMFWIENQRVPDLVPDFLANQNLPAVLPHFQGRLALDFVPVGPDANAPTTAVFFDGLTVTPVPEPETYAMLLAGLGLLGFRVRRRQPAAAAA